MPEDQDARLRAVEVAVGSISQRVQDHETDIRAFASLPVEFEKVRWTQEGMQKSLDAVHETTRSLADRIGQEHEDRIRGHEERRREIEAAREERNAELARIEAESNQAIKRIEAERDRQYLDLQAQAAQQKTESRKMLYGLAAVFLSSLTTVLVQILGGAPT